LIWFVALLTVLLLLAACGSEEAEVAAAAQSAVLQTRFVALVAVHCTCVT
jgi:uncharacterized protein YcfL